MTWSNLEEASRFVDPKIRKETLCFHNEGNWINSGIANDINLSQVVLHNVPTDTLSSGAYHDHPLTQCKLQTLKSQTPTISEFSREGSVRSFSSERKVTLDQISDLLFSSFGELESGKRPYASAGALYPASPVFIGINEKLSSDKAYGVFHYKAKTHELENISDFGQGIERIAKALLGDSRSQLDQIAFAFAYIVNLDISLYKYRYRGYRHALMEVGAMTSVAELNANKLGLSSLIWSGFSDCALSHALGLNPTITPIIVTQLFGFKKCEVPQ